MNETAARAYTSLRRFLLKKRTQICPGFTGAVTLATTPPALGDDFGGLVFENFGHQEAGIYFIQVVTTKGVESISVIVR